jgi:hypothetical protein
MDINDNMNKNINKNTDTDTDADTDTPTINQIQNTQSNQTSQSNQTNTDVSDEVCINFVPETFFTKPKRLCYYKMINKFFRRCDTEMVELMVRIINLQETDISLRVLEWVATKFTPKNIDKSVDINDQDRQLFNINIMYKAQLKSYKKKNFDPFRRDRKFLYNYDKTNPTKTVVTTLGQLNFFKWAISSNIIKYVKDNYEYINNCMIKYNKDDKKKKKTKEDKKKKLEIITSKTKSSESNSSSSTKKQQGGENKERFTLSFD